MIEPTQLEQAIREILRDEMPGDLQKVERAVRRIIEIVDPFERAAREELDRFRATFSELAK